MTTTFVTGWINWNQLDVYKPAKARSDSSVSSDTKEVDIETLMELQDAQYVKSIEEAREEYKSGKTSDIKVIRRLLK